MNNAIKRLSLSQTNRPIDVFEYWRREGYLLLDPPYQRGDVWGQIRQRNLIRSVMTGIPIPSLIVNDREWRGEAYKVAVIDGKQRITALLKFMDGQLKVPGEWFGIESQEVAFTELPVALKRQFKQTPIAVSEGSLKSIEEEREVFELVNFGGVPQGESDLPIEPNPG